MNKFSRLFPEKTRKKKRDLYKSLHYVHYSSSNKNSQFFKNMKNVYTKGYAFEHIGHIMQKLSGKTLANESKHF